MFKKAKHSRNISKARRRAQRASTTELHQWVDVTLVEVGTACRAGTLDEAKMWADVVVDLVEELQARSV